jgi:hypothetical protein
MEQRKKNFLFKMFLISQLLKKCLFFRKLKNNFWFKAFLQYKTHEPDDNIVNSH